MVYSDVDEMRNISTATLKHMAESVGPTNLIPLTALIRRAQTHPSIAWPMDAASFPRPALDDASVVRKWTNAAQWGAGRLAYGVHKYWLWALESERFPRVVYLDADVLIARNIDSLLHIKFEEQLAAVSSAPLCSKGNGFNSGVLVLKPSLLSLVRLLLGHRLVNFPWKGRVPIFDDVRLSRSGPLMLQRNHSRRRTVSGNFGVQTAVNQETVLVANWAERCLPSGCNSVKCAPAETLAIPKLAAALGPNKTGFLSKCRVFHGGKYKTGALIQKSCERHAWDQSVLNWLFSSKWFSLPKEYNVQAQDAVSQERGTISVIHFAGEPKPWGDLKDLALYGSGQLAMPLSSKSWSPRFRRLAERWRAACPAKVVNAGGSV